jgi:hypothetical protein
MFDTVPESLLSATAVLVLNALLNVDVAVLPLLAADVPVPAAPAVPLLCRLLPVLLSLPASDTEWLSVRVSVFVLVLVLLSLCESVAVCVSVLVFVLVFVLLSLCESVLVLVRVSVLVAVLVAVLVLVLLSLWESVLVVVVVRVSVLPGVLEPVEPLDCAWASEANASVIALTISDFFMPLPFADEPFMRRARADR